MHIFLGLNSEQGRFSFYKWRERSERLDRPAGTILYNTSNRRVTLIFSIMISRRSFVPKRIGRRVDSWYTHAL